MIELTSLARPYAKAIFSAALEAGEVNSVESELNLLGQAIQTEQINKIIENPELSKTETAAKLISVFEAELSSLSKRLINVLADNGRLNLLYAIFEIYQDPFDCSLMNIFFVVDVIVICDCTYIETHTNSSLDDR